MCRVLGLEGGRFGRGRLLLCEGGIVVDWRLNDRARFGLVRDC